MGSPYELSIVHRFLLAADDNSVTSIGFVLTNSTNDDLLAASSPRALLIQLETAVLSSARPPHWLSMLLRDNLLSYMDSPPSIILGHTFFLFNEYLTWPSEVAGSSISGGTMYNLEEDFSNTNLQEHLLGFRSLNHDFRKSFPGIIVRIPLRGPDLVDVPIKDEGSVAACYEMMLQLSEGAGEYLLFLQTVRGIDLRATGLSAELDVRVELTEGGDQPLVKRPDLGTTLLLQRTSEQFCRSVTVTFTDSGKRTECKWMLARVKLEESDLFEERKYRQLLPGDRTDTVVAALEEVIVEGRPKTPIFTGKIFGSELNHSSTEQPVHIYSSLHSGKLGSATIVEAWASLLEALAVRVATGPDLAFKFWPKKSLQPGAHYIDTALKEQVLAYIASSGLRVWPTSHTVLDTASVVFSPTLGQGIRGRIAGRHFGPWDRFYVALREVKAPVCQVPNDFFSALQTVSAIVRILNVSAVAAYLRGHSKLLELGSKASKKALLEYLLSIPSIDGYVHLFGLSLFPTRDGCYSAPGYLHTLKLPRNRLELFVFQRSKKDTIDLDSVPMTSVLKLNRANSMPIGIAPWGINDVPYYCQATYFARIAGKPPEIQGSLLSDDFPAFIKGLWEWLRLQYVLDKKLLQKIGELWILPVLSGSYRMVVPPDDTVLVLDPSSGGLGEALLDCKAFFGNQPLFDSSQLGAESATMLKAAGIVKDCQDLESVLRWLNRAQRNVASLPSKFRKEIMKQLANLAEMKVTDCQQLGGLLCGLEIFKEIRNSSKGPILNWTSLAPEKTYVVTSSLSEVPELPSVAFLQCENGETTALAMALKIAEIPTTEELLETYIVPSLSMPGNKHAPTLARFVFDSSGLNLKLDLIEKLRQSPFVPVVGKIAQGAVELTKSPSECVDPNSKLGKFFFEHECVWPVNAYLQSCREHLLTLGMVNSITPELIEERVATYVQLAPKTDITVFSKIVETMIVASMDMEELKTKRLGGAKWLPAVLPTGELQLCTADECRDLTLLGVVGKSMGVLSFKVGPNWSAALGWDEPVQSHYIKSQIETLVYQNDFAGLLKVLDYVDDHHGYGPELRNTKWLWSSTGTFFTPDDIFLSESHGLEPLYGMVANELRPYRVFLQEELGVLARPTFVNLVDATLELKKREPLDDTDLELALRIINLVVRLYPSDDFEDFLLPDHCGILYTIQNLTADEPCLTKEDINFLHPKISMEVVRKLKISSLEDQPDHAEPEQNSAVVDTYKIMEQNLNRFAVEGLFDAVLAYLDRNGVGTEVKWVLYDGQNDETSVGKVRALFWVVDQVITGTVLAQLLAVLSGTGSHCDDNDLLSLYNWSNSLCFITGSNFVQIDSEKLGWSGGVLQADLFRMRKTFPQQLAAFHVIEGFGPQCTFFNGTVLMLQARLDKGFVGHSIVPFDDAKIILKCYLSKVQDSLLFLRQISAVSCDLQNDGGWRVERRKSSFMKSTDSMLLESLVFESLQQDVRGMQICRSSTWILASNHSEQIIEIQGHEGLCLAVNIPSYGSEPVGRTGRLFAPLSLRQPTELGLPIHVQGTDSGILTTECIATIVSLYIELLQVLALNHGTFSFEYWPSPDLADANEIGYKITVEFWNRLRTCELDLFPVVTDFRYTNKVLKLDEAAFDLLSDHESRLLRPLLSDLGLHTLVRPPRHLFEGFAELKAIFISPALLGKLMQGSKKFDTLQRLWVEDGFSCHRLERILKFLWDDRSSKQVLTACRIIPLQNRMLGMAEEGPFYVCSPQTRELLKYCPQLVLHYELDKKTIDLLQEADLNIHQLTISDCPRLFEVLGITDTSTPPDGFLQQFWSTFQDDLISFNPIDLGALSRMPVYSARYGDVRKALTPESFETEAAVVAPVAGTVEAALCAKIPGLFLVDVETLPRSVAMAEGFSGKGILRFARSLSQLALKAHRPLESFVGSVMNKDDVTILRELLVSATTRQSSAILQDLPKSVLDVLRQLPIWPTEASTVASANELLLLPSPSLNLSWLGLGERLISFSHFHSYEKTLHGLGLIQLTLLDFLHKYVLPACHHRELTLSQTSEYRAFLWSLWQYSPTLLLWPPALDGSRKFRRIQDLYYHNNPIFAAAFRSTDKEHFLHPALRDFHQWNAPGGIRCTVDSPTFTLCAKAIQSRGVVEKNDGHSLTQMVLDARNVYEHLLLSCGAKAYDEIFWREIAKIYFVPVQRTFTGQPDFRITSMKAASERRIFSSLTDCVLPSYASVCWSQSAFYEVNPCQDLLKKIGTVGIPPIGTVIAHLRFLSQFREVSTSDTQTFLNDLTETYRFMDQHQPENGWPSSMQQESLFLTIDDDISMHESIKLLWTPPRNLCIGLPHDTGKYRPVKSFLLPHITLLRSLGAETLSNPFISQSLASTRPHSIGHSLLKLWLEDRLCDVEIAINSQTYRVHRAVLAAASVYWKDAFEGKVRDEPVFDILGLHHETISRVLRWCYTGEIQVGKGDKSERLGALLGMLGVASKWEIPGLVERLEGEICGDGSNGTYVTPGNVRYVKQMAAEAKAEVLTDFCERYLELNKVVVDKNGDWGSVRGLGF